MRSRRRGARATGCSLALAANEKLEPRLAFDVAAFEGPDTATIIVSNGDPLYIAELTTEPTSIAFTTEADFLGDENNTDRILNSDRFATLRVTEGRVTTENEVLADQYPSQQSSSFSIFKPRSSPHLGDRNSFNERAEVETRGRISIRQADGSTSEWRFTNWNREIGLNRRYDNSAIRFTTGLNYGGVEPWFEGSINTDPAQSARPDQNYPVSIRAIETQFPQRGFQVQWRLPLTVNSNPVLNLDQYVSNASNQEDVPILGETVRPSAKMESNGSTTFALKDAAGLGLVSGALEGEILLERQNITLSFTANEDGTLAIEPHEITDWQFGQGAIDIEPTQKWIARSRTRF